MTRLAILRSTFKNSPKHQSFPRTCCLSEKTVLRTGHKIAGKIQRSTQVGCTIMRTKLRRERKIMWWCGSGWKISVERASSQEKSARETRSTFAHAYECVQFLVTLASELELVNGVTASRIKMAAILSALVRLLVSLIFRSFETPAVPRQPVRKENRILR